MKRFTRTLHDVREVDVGRNHGVRKICACSRHKHAKCPHAWHFNFSWQGRSYRLSVDRYSGTHVETRADAEALADQLRARIRAGQFDKPAETAGETAARDGTLTFRAFATEWSSRRGYQLVRARDNDYRLKLVYDFALPGTSPAVKFGDKRAVDITTGDIESYRHHRREQGVSPVTSNHDLKAAGGQSASARHPRGDARHVLPAWGDPVAAVGRCGHVQSRAGGAR